MKTLAVAEKRIKELNTKLIEANRERKSAKVALAGVEKQAEDQLQQLRKVEKQLAIAKEQIDAQKKELEKSEEVAARAQHNGYDIGVKEIENALRAQVTGLCRGYYLQVWTEALNLAGVGTSSDLRKTENIFYPPALHITAQPSSQAIIAPKAPELAHPIDASTFKATLKTSKEPSRESAKGKEKEATKDKVPKQSKPPPTTKKASREKKEAKNKAPEPSSQLTAKADTPPSASGQGMSLTMSQNCKLYQLKFSTTQLQT